MSSERRRRSTRLSSKISSTNQSIKTNRRVRNPPLIIVSDDDDDDVVYISSQTPMTADLTITNPQTPSKTFKNNDKNVSNGFLSPTKPTQKSPVKKKSPFKQPPQTPEKTGNYNEENAVTPPKQRKIDNRENISITPPVTPSGLLEKLSLVGSNSELKSNRKKLFQENDLYRNARKALHSTFPTKMPGREKELKDLEDFIMGHLENKTSGSLYVSGPPGTGKTASLDLILQDEKVSSQLKEIYVNCTSIKSSNSIFSRIAKDLGLKINKEKDCSRAVENYLRKNQKPVLLLLDEIDQLESKNQSVLYTIFEWPSIPSSKLILIGIANALDLTDRILPRLQARCELKPKLMHFAPYTKQQIVEIFANRLKDAGVLDIFSPPALHLLAGKVAAVSGDVRRALDIGRRVIELAERKRNEESDVLKSVENLAEELDEQKEQAKSVDLQQVVKVLNNVYGTSQNLNENADEAFPLQQKIIICTLLLILKKAKNKDATIGKLHEVYRKICQKRNIQAVDQGEFVGLCSLIETRGILKIIKKKDVRMNKVTLMWDEEEITGALKDKQLMSQILQDDGCLGKL